MLFRPNRGGGDTHRVCVPGGCFISEKSRSNLVSKLLPREFTFIHSPSQPIKIIEEKFRLESSMRFYFLFIINRLYARQSPLITRRSQVQILAPLPKNQGESQRCGSLSFYLESVHFTSTATSTTPLRFSRPTLPPLPCSRAILGTSSCAWGGMFAGGLPTGSLVEMCRR